MDFLTILRAKLAEIITERNAEKANIDAVLAAPTAEGRSDLNAAETLAFETHRTNLAAIDVRRAETEARIAELEAMAAAEARIAAIVAPAPAAMGAAVVRREERTYNPDAERRGVSFLSDLAARTFGDFDASQRLSRHMTEEVRERGAAFETRAAGTGAFAGLTVPQYLTDLVAPTARAKRPLADICARHPLPAAGMTVNISRITTATSTAVQATENTAVSETNIDDTLLSPAVQTIAGQQTISRQALERGTGVESIVVGDLLADLNTRVDNTLLNQATTGLDALAGTVSVTYTDVTPTAAELWPKLADLIQQIQAGVFAGATHFVMAPRRFWWLASNVGTTFPFVQLPNAAPQMGGTVASTQYDNVAGYLMGLPVILDSNIGLLLGAGTEDRIYAVTASEAHLWEDDAMFIRAEQTSAASLGVLFVVYKYLAYTFGRYPGAHGKIGGSGLSAPVF